MNKEESGKPRFALMGLGMTAVVPFMFGAAPALAQQANRQGDEIIVTAQRREQALIDVPTAITAISGRNLQTLNMSNIASIQTQIPNFTVKYDRGSNSTPSFNIRGIRGDELYINESSIGIYTDEAYLGDVTLLSGSVFDIQRVEVLRGPQGTLFGRNTTGGLVHFLSVKPTREFSGYASLLYGSDDERAIEGAVGGPLSDRVRVRVSGRYNVHDGHFTNEYLGAGTSGIERHVGDKDVWALRGIVDVDLSDNTLLRVIGGYGKNSSQTVPGRTLGALLPGTTTPQGIGAGATRRWSRDQVCSLPRILDGACIGAVQIQNGGAPVVGRGELSITDLTPHDLRINARAWYATANLTHDFDWGTLTSITFYNDSRYLQSIDGDSGATPSIGVGLGVIQVTGNQSHQFSQELRLNGSTDMFDWVAGAYFYKDHKETFTRSLAGTTETVAGLTARTQSEALFAQLDNHLADELTLSVGARFTHEKRRVPEAFTQFGNGTGFQDIDAYERANGIPTSVSVRSLSGRLGLSWEPSSDSTYYASYSRGTKSPGFSFGFSPASSIATNASVMGPVAQETLDAFEIGAKNRFWDNRLSVNTAAFFYTFDGKQSKLTQYNAITETAFSNYINVGTAQLYGVETEINFRPDHHWDFTLSGGLLHSEITKSNVAVVNSFGEVVPLKGKPLDATPEWNFNFIGAYHLPLASAGTFTLQAEVNGSDSLNYSIQHEPLASLGPDRYLANLRLLWESQDKRFNAQAYVTNLFDKRYVEYTIDIVLGTNSGGKYIYREGEGRLWGLKLGMTF